MIFPKKDFFKLIAIMLPILWGAHFILRPYMLWATFSYACLVRGFFLRRSDKKKHAFFMAMGIILDLCLVLILQVQRDAIDTAVHLKLTPLQMCHVFSSTIATVFYFPTMYFGIRLLKGVDGTMKPAFFHRHKAFALSALTFRTLGFLFMFSLLSRN